MRSQKKIRPGWTLALCSTADQRYEEEEVLRGAAKCGVFWQEVRRWVIVRSKKKCVPRNGGSEKPICGERTVGGREG